MDTVLELRHINKAFPGVQALSDMNFTLRKGEVHALLGENGAGKSTLIKIMSGAYRPDSGEIVIGGAPVVFTSPRDSIQAGIGVVYQEVSVFPDLSVMENIFVGRLPRKGLSVDYQKVKKDALDVYAALGMEVDVEKNAGTLGIADKQMLEIAKALSLNSNILILDEPTAALSSAEVDALLGMIRTLKAKGVSIVFISHRIDEIFAITDRVTVIRDGQYIDTRDTASVDTGELVQLMVGRKVSNFYPKQECEIGEEILRVEHISDGGIVRDVSFSLRKGEILGLSGLAGSGRTETACAITGLTKKAAGTVRLHGRDPKIKSYRDALAKGIVYVTEDRQKNGLTLPMSVKDNVTLAGLGMLCRAGVINQKEDARLADEYIEKLGIATPHYNFVVGNLSGGNQQKVSVSKALLTEDPQVLILDEPTKGIDVGAKAEIHGLISSLVKDGMSVIMISSELPELIGMCDRVVVLREGRDSGDVCKEDLTQEHLLSLALGGGEEHEHEASY